MRALVVIAVLAACKAPATEEQPPEVVVVPLDAGARTKKPPSKKTPIVSPLPEKGPHPEYPTPIGAGTDKIFLLEEPDRGPTAPVAMALPASITWTRSPAYCEIEPTAPICGDDGKTLLAWKLGKRGDDVIAQQLRGTTVVATYVYVRTGTTKQLVRFDAYGRVESALVFANEKRYSARKRTGANALPGCGSMELELEKGYAASERCLQWSGDPMHATTGIAKTVFKRSPNGFKAEEARFGADDTPRSGNDGVHRVSYTRDRAGRVVFERYFGVDGKPIENTSGCNGRRTTYDNRGLVTQSTCVGTDAIDSNDATGSAAQEFGYDDAGCKTTMRFRSAPGSAKKLGHGANYVVDELCFVTTHTCVDARGNRQACGTGDPARYDYKRDAVGNTTSIRHYKIDGTADTDPVFGGFETRSTHDDLGNRVSLSCFDHEANPVPCGRLGFHREVMEYDDAGREVKRTFFNEQGIPATNLQAAVRRFTYDNYDHQFESRGFDASGQLLETYGMAIRRDLYDTAHRHFGVLILDKNGEPARYKACYAGVTCPKEWHAVRIVRSANGTVKQNLFFDHAGQLIQTVDCTKSRCFG